MLAKPISDRNRRTVGSLSTIHVRRHHLNRFARNSSLFKQVRPYTGRGIEVVNISAALAHGRTTSRKKVRIMASSRTRPLPASSRIHSSSLRRPEVARHGTGDGKKRVALQKENNKNGREAKPEHNKAANRQSPAIPSHQQTCHGRLFRRRG